MNERPQPPADPQAANAAACIVTGAAGYIGSALTRALREEAAAMPLRLTDRVPPQPGLEPPPHDFVGGEIDGPRVLARLFEQPVGTVFHLAGVVSGAAEADFLLGKRVNLDATIGLLECCRRQVVAGGPVPTFVYASSIAVFGPPLPPRIDDSTAPRPALSYGAHKRACEVLIDDYTRRGFIDGRVLRLPGVVVRPPLANGALSGFNSDLIREPLSGRDYRCPVGPDATLWLCSLHHVIGNLVRLAQTPSAAIGAERAITAPALAVSV
ncbi:MAG TPA: NAD-dependent epimerase/dehydratase family protein, partial [Burkholderiaceae bacterium]|nr:NAD-dependent epimerase/dehydratase family protein [Burkholderiaceae bacterium]